MKNMQEKKEQKMAGAESAAKADVNGAAAETETKDEKVTEDSNKEQTTTDKK
jgi:hypothetical protein